MTQDDPCGEAERELAEALLDPNAWQTLGPDDKALVHAIATRIHHIRSPDQVWTDDATFGQRMADKVAAVGGSWRFVLGFIAFLALWVGLNGWLLSAASRIDPYPFIFLNLLLSMLAALQAPIIMMSQNRQSQQDRLSARLDFEVNLKAEADLIRLEARLDRIEHLILARSNAA